MQHIPSLFECVRQRDLDRTFLDAALLDVASRTRTNAFAWRGQFTPGLPELLLNAYGGRAGVVLDPFAGSGTTLLEGIRRDTPAIGVEVNPAAYLLARSLEVAQLEQMERSSVVRKCRELLGGVAGAVAGGLFGDPPPEDGAAPALAKLCGDAEGPLEALLSCALLLSMGDGRSTTKARITRAWTMVEQLVQAMPPTRVSCRVHLGDARAIPIAQDSVDLTLTSPPYINVFNYHQNYRPAVELLGWEVLPAARSEIGSNRKHRQNRFLTVIQYAQDMLRTFLEMVRVSKNGATVVIVIGRESKVRGVSFANGELLAVLAELSGALRFVRWQERKFLNRFGVTIFEEVLTFAVDKQSPGPAESIDDAAIGREVARFCLDEAVSRAAVDVVPDVKSAIEDADHVKPSPPAVWCRSVV